MDDCFYGDTPQHQLRSTLCIGQNQNMQHILYEFSPLYLFYNSYSGITLFSLQPSLDLGDHKPVPQEERNKSQYKMIQGNTYLTLAPVHFTMVLAKPLYLMVHVYFQTFSSINSMTRQDIFLVQLQASQFYSLRLTSI